MIFLKLGGSLITDKRKPEAPRHEVITRLAAEIAAARADNPDLRLLVGHGSGSYGHLHARQYGTRDGVQSAAEWYGFAVVADAAARLNRVITAALLAAGLPAWSVQPSALLRCDDGRILAGPEETVQLALARGLLPVVFGDVALDATRGGTIAGTEEIFDRLADFLKPTRIILAGEVDGVFTADPIADPTAERIPLLTGATFSEVAAGLRGSHGVDVTGGMAAKVAQSLALAARHPVLEIVICSGLEPGNVRRLLSNPNAAAGTRIRA